MTPFRIRHRLKKRLAPLLDWLFQDPDAATEPVVVQAAAPPVPTPAAPPSQVENVASEAELPQPSEAPPSPVPVPSDNEESVVTDVPAIPAPSAEERQRAHWVKTRRGVLQFVADQGGQSNLREMHEHSEKTYFVAHQAFSRLMEELTEEGLLSYDFDNATATLTSLGTTALES